MPGEPVFIDTVALLALVNADDALHDRTVRAYGDLTTTRTTLVTTEWVLAEFLNGSSRPPLRAAALGLVNALRTSARVSIDHASHDAWERTLALYADRPDKSWSFVDCASVLACEGRRIRRVLTHDQHFAQAGLEVLIR